ncbi:MFS transporter [Flaviaesturariibacter amylovorans]|uniref:MFS transporter n=1 Tax=Flaviaesturariibacter amylovorans TaxID=1084520 RepID=A0ABP8HMM8_9BACT
MQTHKLTAYQKRVIALLALIQFTVVLDFMVMAPLGDLMMKSMKLKATEFAFAVSAYAFSAGMSGLLAAGFADKFDRKKLLLFLYIGFTLGTLGCGLAATYPLLVAARIVTGLFGGVLSSVSFAIIADLFAYDQRGRVMGFVQMSFAVSQVAGIPIGLWLANAWDWHAPFLMIVGVCVLATVFCAAVLRPLPPHPDRSAGNPLTHLRRTIGNRPYWLPFAATALLSIGGFLIMPFSTPFLINNVGVTQAKLPVVYVVVGCFSLVTLPLIGRLADRVGKFPTFLGGSLLAMLMVGIYTHMTPMALGFVIAVSVLMFAGVMSRAIPGQALMTAIPTPSDRGAFMSINSSLQQIAGGIASVIAGWVIVQEPSGRIHHFDTLGWLCIAMMGLCIFFMQRIAQRVAKQIAPKTKATVVETV